MDAPRDAAVDAPIDAPIDAPPAPLKCKWRNYYTAEDFGASVGYGAEVPFGDLESPISASCCDVPNSQVLCTFVDKVWEEVPGPLGTSNIPVFLEHAELFERHGKKPLRTAILSAFHPGPMNDPFGKSASPPLFRARVELDSAALHVVTKDDRLCHGRPLPCSKAMIEERECGPYRRRFASLVQKFCDGLGASAW
ncbi:MAG TPA: hypothetical protein VMZ53_02125 [Kofleriaceae bacterium]|nr:hypothetical protein [Kofleriaceae bacterium]